MPEDNCIYGDDIKTAPTGLYKSHVGEGIEPLLTAIYFDNDGHKSVVTTSMGTCGHLDVCARSIDKLEPIAIDS